MSEKKKTKMIYWTVLCNPLVAAVCLWGGKVAVELCMNGDIAKHLPTILGLGIGVIVWGVVWTILYFCLRGRWGEAGSGNLWNILLMCEVILLVAALGYSGKNLYDAANNPQSRLYKREYKKTHELKIPLQADNLYKDGAVCYLAKLPEKAEVMKAEESTTDVKRTGESYTDQEDGSVYFYLEQSQAWRLVVADAAAGSRFYKMEQTKDGTNWKEVCADPFGGETGVASEIRFRDSKEGTIKLGNASGENANQYETHDGGKTWRKKK